MIGWKKSVYLLQYLEFEMNNKYDHREIEKKWQRAWEDEKIYSPNLAAAENPFYNLMMFPYPSAEGLHVGNMYAFTGTDVFGRFTRMQGKQVFEPIGLDGFGIHSENYALKVGRHPKEQAAHAEQNFYRQLRSIGNGFDWSRTVETYNPNYYKWTQWLFIQMFKNGLAYRKKAEVNWCPSCKTVLSDEQVIQGKCERCSSEVEKKALEQWFFRITEYADRLLSNIDSLNWTEKVKIAQRNWIGKSEGAELYFELEKKHHFVLLHGFTGSPERNFFPWLKKELEKRGHTVDVPELPNSDNPNEDEQVQYVLDNTVITEDTIIYGHSLGSVVAMKVVEKLKKPVHSLILSGTFSKPIFIDHRRPFENTFKWEFDSNIIRSNAPFIRVLHDSKDRAVPYSQAKSVADMLSAEFNLVEAEKEHFDAAIEPTVLEAVLPSIKVFTTRPDTLFGATFMVVAPEHRIVNSIRNKEVEDYVARVLKKSELERTNAEKEKTGVFSELYAINPVNGNKIPIWIADYVLMGYGTGAIMAVPAHDDRDYAFAKKYNLPIVEVIQSKDSIVGEPYIGPGELINSGKWNGWSMPEDMVNVLEYLEKEQLGKRTAQYHLRDWLISRQRYWGPPIPMIYCESCANAGEGEIDNMPGWYPETESKLPVLLPEVEDWKPLGTGKAPLASHPEFYKTKCPSCGKDAVRETDVSDTFLDSAWYFLRYVCTEIDDKAFDSQRIKKWLPVHSYIGGAEHSVLHLLYSRFITMFLKDIGLIEFEEPFSRFFAHGLIIKDGAKMSKSKGNVVIPDEYIVKYGADTLRLYLMFLGPFSDGGDFRDSGIEGMNRFVKRVWKLLNRDFTEERSSQPLSSDREYFKNKTIKKVSEDIKSLSYNTAIASLMEWSNFLHDQMNKGKENITREETIIFLQLIAPFAPHMSDELYRSVFGNTESIHISRWPVFDEKKIVRDTIVIAIQVNGKMRAVVNLSSEDAKDENKVKEAALLDEKVLSWTEGGRGIKKTIYVPGKIINFVV